MVKLFDLIKKGTTKLSGSNTPQLDAEVILSHILNIERIYLYLNRDRLVDDTTVQKFEALVKRRSLGEPIAYITGHKEFMGIDFIVEPGVLIPRGDTEILVEEVIKRARSINASMLIDIGCGSGAIGISIAKNIDNIKVIALDLMDKPLEITRINAKKNEVESRVEVLRSNLLESLGTGYHNRIDVVVSNPPYIEKDEIQKLMIDVKDYEPHSALSGGKDGLDFYWKITEESKPFLRNNGLLAYEIGYNQANEVAGIMESHGFYSIECLQDLGGKDRVVLGYLKK